MFSKILSDELKEVIIQVLSSWQVIAMALVLIAYLVLVSFAARTYRRPHFRVPAIIKARKERKARAPKGESEVETTGDDELGLTEE